MLRSRRRGTGDVQVGATSTARGASQELFLLFHKAALALRLQTLVLARRLGQHEVEVCRRHVVEARLLDGL